MSFINGFWCMSFPQYVARRVTRESILFNGVWKVYRLYQFVRVAVLTDTSFLI
jgi:hypothetical protein